MRDKKGLLYILMATVFFSSMEVAVKATNGAFNPVQLNFLRFMVGGIILFPFAQKKLREHQYKLQKSDYVRFAFLGFMCIVFSMTFYTLCLSYIPAHEGAIIFAGNTYFSILFAALLLKEKMNLQTITALIISFVGMMIIINPLHLEGSSAGVLICIGAAVSFALYGVLGKLLTKGRPTGGIVMTCYADLFGVAELALLMAWTHISSVSQFFLSHGLKHFASIPYIQGISMQNLPVLLYIAIGVTGLGFAGYFLAIDTLGVTMTSLVFFIKPALSPVFAYVFLNEVISGRSLFGLSFVIIGSAMLYYARVKEEKNHIAYQAAVLPKMK